MLYRPLYNNIHSSYINPKAVVPILIENSIPGVHVSTEIERNISQILKL